MGIRPGRTTGSPRMHAGTDVGSTTPGAPVMSMSNGVVERVGNNASVNDPLRGYGDAVVIKSDGEDRWVLYAHMSNPRVRTGDRVQAGQVIGNVSNTTNGQFSPLPGESLAQFRARKTAEGVAPRVMVPHLHIEVRGPRRDGTSPFLPLPTAYPQTVAQAVYNVNPQEWMASKGITFGARGATVIAPGSAAARNQGTWNRGVAGLGMTTAQANAAMGWTPAKLKAYWDAKANACQYMADEGNCLAQVAQHVPVTLGGMGQYEPVRFERDIRFGLTPLQWGLVAATGVAALGSVALLIRRRRR